MAERKPVRLVPRGDRPMGIELVGARRRTVHDLYYFLVGAPWPVVLGLLVIAFLIANTVFAGLYLASGGVAHMRPGNFGDAFFFSVQTMATIGYGELAPRTLSAHLLVTAESMVGLMGIATATGLVFSKFSRPTARVLFSGVAVVAPRDGVPTLMFRMANERANHIVEAQLTVVMLRNTLTKEGERLRKMEDVALLRSQSAAFVLTWSALHPIVEGSPFFGHSPEALAEQEMELVIVFTGFDGTLNQTIHARHSYVASEIRWGHRFVDVISRTETGRRIDYRKFHDTTPV